MIADLSTSVDIKVGKVRVVNFQRAVGTGIGGDLPAIGCNTGPCVSVEGDAHPLPEFVSQIRTTCDVVVGSPALLLLASAV